MTSLATVDFPEPVSPTRPSVSPRAIESEIAVDRVDDAQPAAQDDAAPDREVLDEVANLDERVEASRRRHRHERGAAHAAAFRPSTTRRPVARRVSTARWHATSCPDREGRSFGTSLEHTSNAYGQRGWNGQPLGTWIRLGGSPRIGCRRSLRGAPQARRRLEQAPGVRMLGGGRASSRSARAPRSGPRT